MWRVQLSFTRHRPTRRPVRNREWRPATTLRSFTKSGCERVHEVDISTLMCETIERSGDKGQHGWRRRRVLIPKSDMVTSEHPGGGEMMKTPFRVRRRLVDSSPRWWRNSSPRRGNRRGLGRNPGTTARSNDRRTQRGDPNRPARCQRIQRSRGRLRCRRPVAPRRTGGR